MWRRRSERRDPTAASARRGPACPDANGGGAAMAAAATATPSPTTSQGRPVHKRAGAARGCPAGTPVQRPRRWQLRGRRRLLRGQRLPSRRSQGRPARSGTARSTRSPSPAPPARSVPALAGRRTTLGRQPFPACANCTPRGAKRGGGGAGGVHHSSAWVSVTVLGDVHGDEVSAAACLADGTGQHHDDVACPATRAGDVDRKFCLPAVLGDQANGSAASSGSG